jgi:hypothetical protein
MRRVLLVLVLSAFAAAPPAPAAVTRACNEIEVIKAAVQNGRVPDGYPLPCLQQARRLVASDADFAYTDADRAIRAAILRAHGTIEPIRPPATTTGVETGAENQTGTTSTSADVASLDRPSGDGGGVPGPVIALGGVALVCAGAAAVVELRRRRSLP